MYNGNLTNRPRSRGQAIVELAVSVPLLLFLFMAIFLAGCISIFQVNRENAFHIINNTMHDPSPYQDGSIYAIERNIRGKYLYGATSGSVLAFDPTSVLNGADTYNDSNSLSSIAINNLPGFNWYNAAAGNPTAKFSVSVQKYKVSVDSPIFLVSTTTKITTTSTLFNGTIFKSYFQALGIVAGNSSESRTAFRAGDVQTIMHCYPEIGAAVSNTFDPVNDTAHSAIPTALSYGSIAQQPLQASDPDVCS